MSKWPFSASLEEDLSVANINLAVVNVGRIVLD